ncbi:uncharacterized protein [Triticum aestivum]|uniref:uncharacterized protein n=1 Tax=Triticum aestivum TaxID=4565 RepID=UPI001D012DD3|nr:uncharacterized protein LOC123048600 [Triticum aestivum]
MTPGGEGACLKRYTDPSLFRAQSAKHELFVQETKPNLLPRKPTTNAPNSKQARCSIRSGNLNIDTLSEESDVKCTSLTIRIRQKMKHPKHTFCLQLIRLKHQTPDCCALLCRRRREAVTSSRGQVRSGHCSPNAASTHAYDILQETNADGSASHAQRRPTRMPTLRQMLVAPLTNSLP